MEKNEQQLPRLGEPVPAFEAMTTRGKISFPADYKGKWVILFSHPADFTPICTSEVLTFEMCIRDRPTMVAFRTHVENGSMFNTPPVFPIYVLKETLKWLKSIGGVPEIYRRNQAKAALLYDEIDRNPLFRGTVDKEDRSLMNILSLIHI